MVACGAVGILFLQPRRIASPPVVNLQAIDPTLASLIQTSRFAVLAEPKSGTTWGKLGQALHTAEFTAEAIVCYSNAAARDKSAFRWPYLWGLLELPNQPEVAMQLLARATDLAAGQTDAPRLQLAHALVEHGRFDDAAPHLKIILAANPAHAAARLELARVHLSRNALREATMELQPALTNHYTMRSALLLAAQIALRNGQPDTAAQLSRRAMSMPRAFDWPDPVLREVQGLRADRARLADQTNLLLQQQRTAEAAVVLKNLLEAFPNDAEGLLLLGRLRYMERRCPEAENAFRAHLAVQPYSLNGLIQLSLALLCQQRWADAITTLEKAVALKPDFAQAHSNLGMAHSRAGHTQAAIQSYRDALRCSPGDVNAHIALAEELANAGDVKTATEHVERAAALNPKDPRVAKARQQLGLK